MSFASNSVVAKARAVFGRSLKPEDYTQLASKDTVADVCAYLKQTPRYEKPLASVNPQITHRGQLKTCCSTRCSIFSTAFGNSTSRTARDFSGIL